MKRRRMFIKVIGLLAAGAALNVAVAWGCALKYWGIGGNRTQQLINAWPRDAPANFPSPEVLDSDGKWGYRQLLASVDKKEKWIDDPWPGGSRRQIISWAQGVQQCGLPLLSLEWTASFDGEQGAWEISGYEVPSYLDDHPYKRLPTTPLWPGFAINTLFYAGVLWMLFAGPFALRRMIRRRRGECPGCAYPIGLSAVCTECGRVLHQNRASQEAAGIAADPKQHG